jgi:hypothetical protein
LDPITVSCLQSFNFLARLLETVSNTASELITFEKTSGRRTEPVSTSKLVVNKSSKSLMYFEVAPTPIEGWHPNENIKLPINLY